MSDDSTITASGRYSVVHLRDQWYVACQSEDLGTAPIARTVLDTPLVLFRAAGGEATALLDRCAHRNVPLSGGKVRGGEIECPYHGWRYDGAGVCNVVPALVGEAHGKARRVPRFATRERQGLVWIYATPDVTPEREPYEVPHLGAPAYESVRLTHRFAATLHATAENILDVPHTAFLHRGLFRGAGKANVITAHVRRGAERVEAEFVGEPRPAGLAGRLLAPGGGEVRHVDRFILPSIAQVEYGLGSSHLVITNLLTPVSDFVTDLTAVTTFRLPVAAGLVRRIFAPLAKRIVQQDAQILRQQTETVRRFGGEQFVSTDVDLLGPHILRLLKQAERGEKPVGGEISETTQIRA